MTAADATPQRARDAFAFGYVLAAVALLGPATALFAPIAVTPLFITAAVAATGRQYRLGQFWESLRSVPALFFAALVVWGSISLNWSIDAALGQDLLRRLVPLMIGTLMILAAAATFDEKEKRVLMRGMIAGFILGFVLLVIEVWTLGGLHRTLYLDLLGHPALRNGFLDQGAVWLVLLSLPLALALHQTGRPLVALLVLLPCAPLAYRATDYSAGIAGILALVTLALVWSGGKWMVGALGIFTCCCALLAPLFPFGPFAPEHWRSVLSGVKSTGMQRLYIWEFAARHVFLHPIHGWGLNTSRAIPGGMAPNPAGGTLLQQHPHNAALQLWLELGLPGALILTGLIGYVFFRAAKLPDRFQRAGVTALLAAMMTILCTSYGVWQAWWLSTLVLIAAMAIALCQPAAPVKSLNPGPGLG